MNRIIIVFVMLTACGLGRQPNYYSVNPDGTRSERYSRLNEYSAYGTAGLGAQQTISAAYEKAQHAPPPTRDVLLIESYLAAGRLEIVRDRIAAYRRDHPTGIHADRVDAADAELHRRAP